MFVLKSRCFSTHCPQLQTLLPDVGLPRLRQSPADTDRKSCSQIQTPTQSHTLLHCSRDNRKLSHVSTTKAWILAKALIWTAHRLWRETEKNSLLCPSLNISFKDKGVGEHCGSLLLIGVDHELIEVRVLLDDAQWNHISNISVSVLQLVQLQVHSEHVLPDGVRTRLQTSAHDVPAGKCQQMINTVIVGLTLLETLMKICMSVDLIRIRDFFCQLVCIRHHNLRFFYALLFFCLSIETHRSSI